MRVLWFTNIPMPAVDRRAGRDTKGSGHWMTVLLDALRARGDLELGVATAYPGVPDLDFVEDGVRYFAMAQPRFTPALACRAPDLERARHVVETFRPEVVHVHGTERFFALLAARRLIDVPTVVSIQGLLSAYLPQFFGALSLPDVVRTHRVVEVLTRRGLVWAHREYASAIPREEEILASDVAFLGRTEWDLANVLRRNPAARYFHVGELLRPEFSTRAWSAAACVRGRIFVTNVGHPRRGVETILDAVAALRGRGRDVEARLAGSLPERTGYGRFVRRKIDDLGLRDAVRFLGFLDGERLADELVASNVYVIASYAENSPNSLCEAMRLGLPCVASYAGGIPSLVQDGETGLLFPPGDPALLALRLDAVLGDTALAARLGAAARSVAAGRHDPGAVTRQLIEAYAAVLAGRPARARDERAV